MNFRRIVTGIILVTGVVLFKAEPVRGQAVTFTDIAASAGVDDNGQGRGASWGDYDNDGYQDLALANGDGGIQLFRNNGVGAFVDVTSQAGLVMPNNWTAVVWGDYNNDGWLDFYAVSDANANRLYRNNADGTFTDVAVDAGVADSRPSNSATWGDYNHDGWLDLYVSNYNQINRLYRNNSNGTFTDVANSAGVADPGHGGGASWADVDNDGDLDLYVANEFETGPLYRNNGDGTFMDIASSAGLSSANKGFGIAWLDYDNDENLDLYIANLNGGRLFRNNGNSTFSDVTTATGTGGVASATGVAVSDIDNDGWLDMYVANDRQQIIVYHNNGDGTFSDIRAQLNIDGTGTITAAFADYDRDGDLDLYLPNFTGTNRLYRNNGTSNRWLHVNLTGTVSNRDGIGARLTAVDGTRRQRRDIDGGTGYSYNTLLAEFGFGSVTMVDSLIIRWPSGLRQVLTNVATNQFLAITEAQDPVTLALARPFDAPGDTLRVPVTLTNPTTAPVGGLQLSVVPDDTTEAHFVGLEDTASNPGFTVSSVVAGDTTRLVIFSGSGANIQPGTDILLATLVYRLDPSATLGNTIPLTLTDVEVSDTSGVALSDSTVNGELQAGIRGDVTLDGRVSILDVVRTVRIIIGKEALPDTGTTAFHIADMNEDGSIDIADVVAEVNAILGLATKPVASGPTSPVTVALNPVSPLGEGQLVIPLVLDANGLIAGVQAAFTFDPSLLDVGAPYPAEHTAGLSIDSHVVDGVLRVVLYAPQPGQGIAAGHGPVLFVPVTVREGVSTVPSLTLARIILVDPQAQRVPVLLGETIIPVVKEGVIVPTSFALSNATPNPFNPSTTISYDVPQQAHVTLVVYNLLGQEVVRLVDAIKSPGRYTASWNGTNRRGVSVASGVYVYRITSSTGFSATKRMTLLK